MSQIFFSWPHGGKSVSVAGTFNNWSPQTLQKQGNSWFGVFDLPDGIYQYKYLVDGRWVYDIGQIHADDGGNWNNEVVVGKVAGFKEPGSQPISRPQQPKEQSSHQKPQQQQQQQQQQPKEQSSQQQPQQKSKKTTK